MTEKYIIAGIVICSCLILSLFLLIIRAYVTQNPLFSFLHDDTLNSEMTIIASIAQAMYFIGFLFFLLIILFFSLFNYQWYQFLVLPIFAFLGSILASFIFLFKSYDWQIDYLKYRYAGLLVVTFGAFGQYIKVESNLLSTAHKIQLSGKFDLFLGFPFYIFLIVGYLLLMFSFPSSKQ